MSGTRGTGRVALALVVWGLVLGTARPTLAHAVLISSDPPHGAALEAAPRSVTLRFNEPVSSDFSPAMVRNQAGERVDAGDARVLPGDPTAVRVGLKPVGTGLYTVVYRVVSLDGHLVQGTLAFSVGNVAWTAPPEAEPVPGVPLSRSLARGVFQVLAAVLAGAVVFRRFLWPGGDEAERRAARKWAAALTLASGAAGAAELAMYAASASGEPLSAGLFLHTLVRTRTGHVWLARFVAAALTGTALAFPDRARGHVARNLILLPGIALLLSLTVQSHAAASRSAAGILADAAHLVAAATWAGGLFGFAVLAWPSLRGLSREAREARLVEAVPRFSRAAVAAVLVLAATGTYSALRHVPSWGALTGTHYGQMLVVKLALLAPLLGLGGYNLLHRGRGRFREAVLLELVLISGVFLAAGRLSSVPPATVEQVQRAGPFEGEMNAGGLNVHLRVEPNRVGYNRVTVRLTGPDGRPESGAAVSVSANMVAMDMGLQEHTAREKSPGVYEVEQLLFGMDGVWRVDVSALTTGGREIRTTFEVSVPPPLSS